MLDLQGPAVTGDDALDRPSKRSRIDKPGGAILSSTVEASRRPATWYNKTAGCPLKAVSSDALVQMHLMQTWAALEKAIVLLLAYEVPAENGLARPRPWAESHTCGWDPFRLSCMPLSTCWDIATETVTGGADTQPAMHCCTQK